MGKIALSTKRKTLSKKPKRELRIEDFEEAKAHNPDDYLADPNKMALAFLDCLQNNDPEAAMEMIEMYLNAVDRVKLRKETQLHKATVHSALKHRNPTIKTLAKIMYTWTH